MKWSQCAVETFKTHRQIGTSEMVRFEQNGETTRAEKEWQSAKVSAKD